MAIPQVAGISELIKRMDKLVEQRPPGDPVLPPLLFTGDGADQLVHGFADRLTTATHHAVPHVHVEQAEAADGQIPQGAAEGDAGDGGDDLELFDGVANGLARSMPPRMGKLRLDGYWTVRDILDVTITSRSYRAQRKQLRDELYRRRQDHNPLIDWIGHTVDDPAEHRVARFWQTLAKPVLVGLPRAVFGWRLARGRRLRWLGDQIARVTGQGDVLGSAISLTRNHPGGNNSMVVRRVLLLALLRDLEAESRSSLLSPARRRRVTPFVLLLTGVRRGSGTYRFLETFGTVQRELKRGSTLVLASVPSEADVPPSLADASPHRVQPASPSQAGATLESLAQPGAQDPPQPGALTVAVPVGPHDEQAAAWLAINQKVTPAPGWWPRLVPALSCAAGVVTVLSAAALIWYLLEPGTRDDPEPTVASGTPACRTIYPATGSAELIGVGDGTAACTFFPEPADAVQESYRKVELDIAEENERVLRDPRPSSTVVFFAPLTLPEGSERVGQSSLRQLRGVALAQRQVNEQAERDENKVRIQVLLANPGDRFAHGPEVAAQINDRVDEDGIVGVLGIAQSRGASREAITALAESNLPVVAGPLTGDAMTTSSPYYYQVSPLNERVAKMLVEVATELPVVGPGHDDLRPTRRAVIVKDHSDEYSQNLATDLEHELAEAGHMIASTITHPIESPSLPAPERRPDEAPEVPVSSHRELAQEVCSSIDPDRDVVFFASRAQQLEGMLDNMHNRPGCEGTVTVLAGTDITKAVQNPDVDLERYPFLRLYYGAFAASHDDLDPVATGFAEAYEELHGQKAFLEDFEVDMSDPALTYDALSALQEAINLVFEEGHELTPDRVATKIGDRGIAINGATGYIALGGTTDSYRVPPNKPVLVLQAIPKVDTPLVLSCGRFSSATDHDTWGPRDQFACPDDD